MSATPDRLPLFRLALLLFPMIASPALAESYPPPPPPGAVRVATFNIFELSCAKLEQKGPDNQPANQQLKNAAEILKRVRPHIVLINEIDYHPIGGCAKLFYERYLATNGDGLLGLEYPYSTYLAVNTGVQSGLDLNNDGDKNDAEDAWGFGEYPGQYGMAIFSSFKIDEKAVRTFQNFLWKDMPGNLMPDGQGGRAAYYPAKHALQLRLSSKSHWDVPVTLPGGRALHLLASHPVPPVFDGPEDRNGLRNFDEIRLWADYLTGGKKAEWLVDDQGRRGGLDPAAAFVILGDLNADPVQGERVAGHAKNSIHQLLDHPRVNPVAPVSQGDRPPRTRRDGTPYPPYAGDPKTRTADYGRLDYVLPSRNLEVLGSGVYYPAEGDPRRHLVLGEGSASDHNLVFVDLRFPPE
jgi:hypothetical protein